MASQAVEAICGQVPMTPDPGHSPALQAAAIPDVLQGQVSLWLTALRNECALDPDDFSSAPGVQAQLLRLVASSEFAADNLKRYAGYFQGRLDVAGFDREAAEREIQERTRSIAADDPDIDRAKAALRQLRNQHLVLILWRSMRGADSVQQTLHALSYLADRLIEASSKVATRGLETQFGKPVNDAGDEVFLLTLAMGKLGGKELNFSSDIDLVFLYTEEGVTTGQRSISAHEYFARLSRRIVALLDEVSADGFVYRVDTRLRPFGDSGPPVVSLASFENYLLQHGRSWERYAYIKCRPVGMTTSGDAIGYLQKGVIEPFVYRRYLDFGVFEALRDMKSLIAAEVARRELQNNVKLGPGGIREIEFIAQALQLVRGGAEPQLRCRELHTAMRRLGASRNLAALPVDGLLASYYFLRKLENALQALRDQQTHDLPETPEDQARLALAMEHTSWPSLLDTLHQHRQLVIEQFEDVVFRSDIAPDQADLAALSTAFWDRSASRPEWQTLFADNGFPDAERLAESITSFGRTAERRQTDVAAQKRLSRFIATLILSLRERRRPALACERTLAVIAGILRRSAYVALLNENQSVLDRLVGLCEQSAYLAEEIARFPVLLDELLDPRLYTMEISAVAMRADLNDRLAAADVLDIERRVELLAQFQRAMLFRIAVADVSGNLPIMQVSDRLTELAEIVLQNALSLAMDDLTERHGKPLVRSETGSRTAGFGVIAYGKFGGIEMSYRSDLDLVFLHDSPGGANSTDGNPALENSMFFGRLVRRLVHFLTVTTPSGALYEIDTRLRPSGRSGLLVVSVDGFERYQEENAWTWEHQALLRSRAVAGSPAIAREFERIRSETLCRRVHFAELQTDVCKMREKMRRQLDRSDADNFDLKQGVGGIGDIEFLVQYLILKNARDLPALLHYTDNIRQLGMLESAGVLAAHDVAQLQHAYKAYRLRTHRLALDDAAAVVAAHEFPMERQQVSDIWRRVIGC